MREKKSTRNGNCFRKRDELFLQPGSGTEKMGTASKEGDREDGTRLFVLLASCAVILISCAMLLIWSDSSPRVKLVAVKDAGVGGIVSPKAEDDAENAGLLNINTATAGQLADLPGIGEKLAQRIVLHRMWRGGFDSIEDIMTVEGIGEQKFEQIKDLITVDTEE